ncbi:MAG: PaaI family thioesterase [Kiloniellales bacterium]
MPDLKAADSGFIERVEASFAAQSVMVLIGAELGAIRPGQVEILLPYRPDLCQQNGFLHAGIVTTIADSAAGYAAFTLFTADEAVLTSEFGLHLLSPAAGPRFRAVGKVLKPGRRLVIAETEVFAERTEGEVLIAKMTATLVRLPKQA